MKPRTLLFAGGLALLVAGCASMGASRTPRAPEPAKPGLRVVKAVDAGTAKQLTRIQSDPLRGSPDDLIEGVRVAAYKLLAPDQLHGSIQIQTDLVGVEVQLDGITALTQPQVDVAFIL